MEFKINSEYAAWINEGVFKALEAEEINVDFGLPKNIGSGMLVRLTEQGDTSIPADFGDPMPYKAERIVYNKTTRTIDETAPVFTFDPDEAASGINFPAFVYELNGTPGLTGGIFWIDLHAFKSGTGDMYWAFSVNGQSQFAKITAESGGLYSADQLDKALIPTGLFYDGTDFPQLRPLNAREKIPIGQIVEVLIKEGMPYFSWKDPIHEMGPEDKPSNDAGTYVPFAEQGGTSGPSTANFDPADGIFKHAHLHAVGQDTMGSGTGQPVGLKIEQIDLFNYKLVLIDNGGNEIDPISPLPPNPDARTYCTEASFNAQTRMLTLTTKDDLGAVICTKQTQIPCCEMPKNPGDTPTNPHDPSQDPEYDYPTDSPSDPGGDPNIVYEDECTPPEVYCDESQQHFYPVPAQTTVGRINIKTGRVKPGVLQDGFTIVLVEVLDPNSNDITADFVMEGVELIYQGEEDIGPGKYQFSVRVEAPPQCDYSDFFVVCYFDVIEIECNDSDSTDDGTGGDYCPVPCEQITLVEGSQGLNVLNKFRDNDSGQEAHLTVQMDLKYQSYLRVNNGKILAKDKNRLVKKGRLHLYRKHVTHTESIVIDADKSWSKNISVPVATPNRNKALNRVPNGRLEIRYKSTTKEFLVSYREGFSFTASIATPGQDGLYKRDDAADADGYIRSSINIFDENDDPKDGEDFVGVVEIKDPCENGDWTFEIVGGVDQALFRIVPNGTTCEIYVKPGTNTIKASYDLEIKASSVAANCIKDIDLTIPQRSPFEDVMIDNAVADGRAGAAVATVCAVDGAAQRIPDGGRQNAFWQVANVNDGTADVGEGKQYFQIEPIANGDAILRSRVDIPEGNYTITVRVQNDAMLQEATFVEKTVMITVDKTVTYEPTVIKGLL